jgi:hypothetical protein
MAYTFNNPAWDAVQASNARNASYTPPPVTNYYVTVTTPAPTPVTPTFDPKIEANALYGKPMSLMAGGYARIGASPAPIIGPYLNAGLAYFAVSLGLAVPVTGERRLYKIYLDQELAWECPTGGIYPADGTFKAEAFDFEFLQGTLTQTFPTLESNKFPGDENAYRPQMVLQITALPYQRFLTKSGKPVPYVACEIGDVTDGADPADGINLGEGWQRVAYSPWANYTSSTAEYLGISDVVDAYLLKDNFTIVQLGQTNTRIYRNIDLLQSDKLRLVNNGSVNADIVFDRDSIIADNSGPIQITRAGATEQRRELELISVDPDQDYTAVSSLAKIPRDPFTISAAVGKETITSPLVLDANTRQALVTYAQQYEENARKKIAFKVRAIGFETEPGDLVGLIDIADGIDDEVWKVTNTVHRADFIVEIEAEAILRCRLGTGSTGGGGGGDTGVTGTAWNTSDKNAAIVLSNGSLTADASAAGGYAGVRGVTGQTTGKYYFEATYPNDTRNSVNLSANLFVGIADGSAILNQPPGFLNQTVIALHGGGTILFWNGSLAMDNPVRGDTICVAADLGHGKVWWRVNNGNWNGSALDNPATNTGGLSYLTDVVTAFTPPVYPFWMAGFSEGLVTANFGDLPFLYSPPSGFTAGWPT